MNLMFLINSFNLGGAEKLCYDIAINLKKTNHNIYICSMSAISTPIEKEISQELQIKGINILSLEKGIRKDRVMCILKLRKYLYINKIEVLHTNGQSPDFFGRIATILIPQCKVVVTIHSTFGYSKRNEFFLKRLTDQYIAISNSTRLYMEKELGVTRSIHIIENGIDVDRYKGKIEKKNKKEFIILSVGRIMEAKGYIELGLQMTKFLRDNTDAKWVIVGDKNQSPEYFSEFINSIGNNVRNRVICTDTVTNPEKYYNEADCFLLNSSYEGFGIALIEAMIAKLPIICRNVGIIPSLISKGVSVCLLENNNLLYYLENIKNKKLINQNDLNSNYDIVSQSYSIKETTNKYLDIYMNLVKS